MSYLRDIMNFSNPFLSPFRESSKSYNTCRSERYIQIIQNQECSNELGYNCIQNFDLEYTVGNLVLQQPAIGAIDMIFNCISNDVPPKMKNLNMVIPILMHFCSFVSNWSVASLIKPHVI